MTCILRKWWTCILFLKWWDTINKRDRDIDQVLPLQLSLCVLIFQCCPRSGSYLKAGPCILDPDVAEAIPSTGTLYGSWVGTGLATGAQSYFLSHACISWWSIYDLHLPRLCVSAMLANAHNGSTAWCTQSKLVHTFSIAGIISGHAFSTGILSEAGLGGVHVRVSFTTSNITGRSSFSEMAAYLKVGYFMLPWAVLQPQAVECTKIRKAQQKEIYKNRNLEYQQQCNAGAKREIYIGCVAYTHPSVECFRRT